MSPIFYRYLHPIRNIGKFVVCHPYFTCTYTSAFGRNIPRVVVCHPYFTGTYTLKAAHLNAALLYVTHILQVLTPYHRVVREGICCMSPIFYRYLHRCLSLYVSSSRCMSQIWMTFRVTKALRLRMYNHPVLMRVKHILLLSPLPSPYPVQV